MPFKSKSQAKLFFAAANGDSDKISKETAKKFIKDTDHQKTENLPEHKSKFKRLKSKMSEK